MTHFLLKKKLGYSEKGGKDEILDDRPSGGARKWLKMYRLGGTFKALMCHCKHGFGVELDGDKAISNAM